MRYTRVVRKVLTFYTNKIKLVIFLLFILKYQSGKDDLQNSIFLNKLIRTIMIYCCKCIDGFYNSDAFDFNNLYKI